MIQDLALFVVCFAFFSCGLAIQAAAARLIYSYSRDGALPASRSLSRVSPRFRTPVNALLVAAIIPVLFAALARFTPSTPIVIGFITIPAKVNALFLLVSFAVSGIYLSFLLVVVAALIARLRGWKAQGAFRLGAWAIPVMVAGCVWLVAMLVNILIPSGITSPRGALFNYDWITLVIVVIIVALGAIYTVLARPARRIARSAPTRHKPVVAAARSSESLRQSRPAPTASMLITRELHLVPPTALGLVHGDVSGPDQILETRPLLREARDADRRGDVVDAACTPPGSARCAAHAGGRPRPVRRRTTRHL